MSGFIQRQGNEFRVGELCFCQDEIDLNFGIKISDADGRHGVATVVIQKEKEKEIKGCVWLCPDNALKLQIGEYFGLIAEEVKSPSEAFKKTINFFFSL